MKCFFTYLVVLISISINAQKFSPEFDVSRDDLESTFYKKDTSAVAVMLYDYGKVYVNNKTFRLNSEFKQKIKILKADGLERGEIKLRAFKNSKQKEKISNIIGFTYNLENGKIVKTKMEADAIFTVSEENYDEITFALPKLKPGSVFTVSYSKDSPFFDKYQPWYFQTAHPVLYSEFNTSIPGNFKYNTKLVGDLELKERDHWVKKYCLTVGEDASADCSESHFVMTDIPAYYEEDFTTAADNYISRIEYELISIQQFDGKIKNYAKTWEDVEKELKNDNDFGRQIKRKSLVKKVLPEELKTLPSDEEKARKLYQFVLDNYKWDGTAGRYDVSVSDLLKEQSGSAFELNLLLLNLLFTEGYEVYPVLSSTRNNGFVTKLYPVLSEFNYLFVKLQLGDKKVYLDATSPYRPFGDIAFKVLNGDARVIDFDEGSYWEKITAKDFSINSYRISTKINDDETLDGTLEHQLKGFFSYANRRAYFENPSDYVESLQNNNEDFNISNHKVLQKQDNEPGFDESYDISIELEEQGDKVFFNPFLYRFFEENPFKHEQRSYPIDFGYKSIFTYAFELDLNGKYKVIELPEEKSYALPGNAGTLSFTANESNGKVIIFTKMKLDEAKYKPGFYYSLQSLFAKLIDVQKNSLILLERI